MIDWMTNVEKVWALIFTFLGVEGPNEGLQTAVANGPKQPVWNSLVVKFPTGFKAIIEHLWDPQYSTCIKFKK